MRPLFSLALAAFVASSMATASPSHAADWPLILGTEEGLPDEPYRPVGFVQAVAEGSAGTRVYGLESKPLSRFEGARPSFNTVGDGDAAWGFSVRRARIGLRGSVPKLNRRITYFVTADLGNNAVVRDAGARLVDASITFSLLRGARVRVGQFKLPIMDETLESNPLGAEFIDSSTIATGLALENRVVDGRYVGPASGYRDVGVQIFDTFQRGKVALSYAAMLSNGRFGAPDEDAAKDVTARVSAAWVFAGKPTDPHRQELSFFTWGQHGTRTYGGARYVRAREGVGVHLEREPFRIRAELVHATGMLVLGPSPSFAGEPIAVAPEGRALGGYVQARVRLFGKLLVGGRYEELHRQLGQGPALRVLRTITAAVEWDFTPRAKLMLNYEKRLLDAPEGSADARRIADTMADRIVAQATVVF